MSSTHLEVSQDEDSPREIMEVIEAVTEKMGDLVAKSQSDKALLRIG